MKSKEQYFIELLKQLKPVIDSDNDNWVNYYYNDYCYLTYSVHSVQFDPLYGHILVFLSISLCLFRQLIVIAPNIEV